MAGGRAGEENTTHRESVGEEAGRAAGSISEEKSKRAEMDLPATIRAAALCSAREPCAHTTYVLYRLYVHHRP